MKTIRWGGLIAFFVIGAVVIAVGLFSGALIKPVLESKLSEMNGARVDIDAVNIGYSPFSLEIDNIQIADPVQPMLNTAQIAQLRMELSFARLLMGQLVIEDASINGVQVETPRTTSGLLAVIETPEVVEEAEETSFDIPGFDLPDIDDLLAKNPLQSEILLDKLNKDIADKEAQWETTKQNLPDSAKVKTYDTRFNKIKRDSKGDFTQKLAAIKAAKTLIKEIKDDAAKIKAAKNQLSGDLKYINKSIKQVKNAPSKDLKSIKGKYSLDGAGAENITRMLFGDEVAVYLAKAREWYERIEPYLDSEEEAEAEPIIERGKGIDVVFVEYDPKPDFFIRLASITAELPRGQFEGEITNISSDQSINKKPMRFKLQGVDMVKKESESITGEFNYVNKSNSFAQLNYILKQAQLEALTISRSSQLPLDMNSALMTANVNARLQNGTLKGSAKTKFRRVDFEVGSSSMFASAFEGVKAFDIDTKFSGAIDALSVKIDSDLDNQLGKQLKAQLTKKKVEFEKKLKARIDEKIKAPMARIEAKKNELIAVKQKVDNSGKQLQQKLASLKDIINKEKDLKKKEANDKLKNKLKDKFGF